jgi:thymidylate synthase
LIPVLQVHGKGISEVWEKSLVELWKNGMRIKTEYDKPKDPQSVDAIMIMVAEDPLLEPRIHLSIPASFKDLQKYKREVLDGVHDHWIDPSKGKWTYTYHQRLFNFPSDDSHIAQIDYIVNKLSEALYTRRAQAITWNPKLDPLTDDPPCLQRIWLRGTEEDGSIRLNMNTHWRSRDAYKAAFMNMFALTELQKRIALMLSHKINRIVEVGQYVDISDSYHIYGSYIDDFEKRFLKLMEQRDFYSENIIKSRTIFSSNKIVQREFAEAETELEKETQLK